MNVPWVHQRSTLQNAHRTQSNGLLGARSTEGELWGGTQLSRKKKKINHQRRITPGEHTQDTAPRGQHFAGSPCSCEHGTQNGCCTTAAVAAGRFPAPSPEEQNQYAGEAPLRQWETSCAKTKRMDRKITKQKAFLQSL